MVKAGKQPPRHGERVTVCGGTKTYAKNSDLCFLTGSCALTIVCGNVSGAVQRGLRNRE